MRFKGGVTVTFQAECTLTESEARALHALTEYGTDNFLKAFFEKLGSAALKPHEAGLRALFETIKGDIGPQLRQVDALKKSLQEAKS